MFPRGFGPLCSVIIPTRGRPGLLCRAIDSIYSLCRQKNVVEFVLKIDSDDTETIAVAAKLSETLPCKIIMSCRGDGYYSAHHWYNEMCTLATGDWIFVFNDDAIMITDGWDDILSVINPYDVPGWRGNYDVCLLGTNVVNRHPSWELPMFRRVAFSLLGHMSLFAWSDAWLFKLYNCIGALIMVNDIKISHDIIELYDQTRKEGRDGKFIIAASVLAAAEKELVNDAIKLRDYIRGIK